MQIRTDLVSPVIAAGIELFTSESLGEKPFPNGVPRYNVLAWLFQHCMDEGVALNILERYHVVEAVCRAANNVLEVPGHPFTVRELRERLQGLPENLPVLYQRIEDAHFDKHGWTTHPLMWEMRQASPEDLQWVAEHPHPDVRIVERDGVRYIAEYSQCIPAHSASVSRDPEGRHAFVINAHY